MYYQSISATPLQARIREGDADECAQLLMCIAKLIGVVDYEALMQLPREVRIDYAIDQPIFVRRHRTRIRPQCRAQQVERRNRSVCVDVQSISATSVMINDKRRVML